MFEKKISKVIEETIKGSNYTKERAETLFSFGDDSDAMGRPELLCALEACSNAFLGFKTYVLDALKWLEEAVQAGNYGAPAEHQMVVAIRRVRRTAINEVEGATHKVWEEIVRYYDNKYSLDSCQRFINVEVRVKLCFIVGELVQEIYALADAFDVATDNYSDED